MRCQITRRKTRQKPAPSRVYRGARWEPVYPGAQEYRFIGEEIERDPKYQYQIKLVETQPGAKNAHRQSWPIATLTYWDIVEDYLNTLRQTWYRQKDIWGINEGLIIDGIAKNFPITDHIRFNRYKKLILNKFEQTKTQVIADYQKSEEYPLQVKKIKGANEELRRNGHQRQQASQKPPEPDQDQAKRRFHSEQVFKKLVSFRSITDIGMATEIVTTGYRRMCMKYHPDKGGSADAMQRLTAVKNQMLKLLKNGMSL